MSRQVSRGSAGEYQADDIILQYGEFPGFPGVASGKEPACQCRRQKRLMFIPGLGRFPGGGRGNPLQYSCLENPMDRGAWQATVQRVAKSCT